MVHCHKMKITCQGSSRQIAEGIVDLSCSASWSVWITSRLAEAAAGTVRAPGASKFTDLPKPGRVSFTLMLWLQVTKELTHIYFYLPFLLPFDSHLYLPSLFQGPEPQARAGADVQEGVAFPTPGFGHVGLQEGTVCWKSQKEPFMTSSSVWAWHLFNAGEDWTLLVSVSLPEPLCLHYTVLTRFTGCCRAFWVINIVSWKLGFLGSSEN